MVIQRIQTLYLIIAIALMAVFCFCIPVAASAEGAKLLATGFVPVLVIGILTLLLMAIDIFLYRNLKQQINVCLASAVLIFGTMLTTATSLAFNLPEGMCACWAWPTITSVAALFFTVMAFKGMKKDQKTLRDADRLW